MINISMRKYDFFTFDNEDAYGQPALSNEVQGEVKMSISLISQGLSDNSLYSEAQYIGLTLDKNVDSKYVIQFGDEKLKVLYVNPYGRCRQVYMKRM